MPFTVEQFLEVFAEYNQAVYPMQFLLMAAGLFLVYLAFKPTGNSSKFIATILAFFWLWMGIAYHLIFFSQINPAASLFGIFFILQGAILLYSGVLKDKLSFHFHADGRGLTGLLLVLYALIFYPLLNLTFGHIYPQSPTFGLPCPTTIFTFGLFLWTDKKVPLYVLLIPFVWSLIGFSAAFLLNIYEDFGLPLASIIGMAFLLWSKPKRLVII